MLISEVPLKIESGNTDGINILYNKSYTDKVQEICHRWELITSAELERTRYQKVIRTTVNDYMAIKDDGSVKYKGDFEMDKELHKDTSMYIVRSAIDQYYRFSIPVRKTIEACTNIFDFTKSVKIQGTSQGKWRGVYDTLNGREIVRIDAGKNIRYYVDSTGRGKLRKVCYQGNSEGKVTNVEASNSVVLFNQYIHKDNFKEYNVNYNYYVAEAMKIINSVHDGQLSLW